MRFGVDVGGTTVKIGCIDNHQIIFDYQIKTTAQTLFDDICVSIKESMEAHNIKSIEGIGFGIPGNVVNNFIYKMPNIGLENVDVAKVVGKYFPNIKICCQNDANVAALGEALADGNTKNSYMLTLGTGVGGGLVLDGKVIEGTHAACGEIGHMFIDFKHNYQCTCGLKGCLETVSSATGIVRLAKHYFNDYKTSLKYEELSAKKVFDAAKNNDELGLFVMDMVADYLARGLAVLAVAVDVECFFIGGGVSACGQILIDKIKERYVNYAHFAVKTTEIKLAKLGNTAGMLGAAYLF